MVILVADMRSIIRLRSYSVAKYGDTREQQLKDNLRRAGHPAVAVQKSFTAHPGSWGRSLSSTCGGNYDSDCALWFNLTSVSRYWDFSKQELRRC